ncbi:MAG TPA: ROK family protein [Candidatus Rifleibacterium sp.]|nr:ROK family protein [Candidatus Rifleibacterium sp.]
MANAKNLCLGIDLGGTKVAVGLCKGEEILKKAIFPTQASAGFDGVISVILGAVEKVMEGHTLKEVSGAGIGSAGQIDGASGEVIYSPNLGWRNAPLGNAVSKALGLPVKVLNDVRAATVAEQKFGNGKGLENFGNIFVGTGVGSGWVINGQLMNGVTNPAGEIGHICMDPEGPLCGCGNRGCLEAYCSGTGMENYVKAELKKGRKSLLSELAEHKLENVRGPLIGKAAEQGDELALEAIHRVGKYLGLALANVHTLLNPEVVLLGGGMMALKKFFLPQLDNTLRQHILPVAANHNRPLIKEARFENDAVLLGGAAVFA